LNSKLGGEMQIKFGIWAPKLREQLGIRLKTKKSALVSHIQKDSDAINRLYIRGVLTFSERNKTNKRLVRSLEKLM
jgi:hypothetical protein